MTTKKGRTKKGRRRRLTRDEGFMMMAVVMSQMTTCVNHKVASIFVKNNKIISTGYNGSSIGDVHCNEVGCAKVDGVDGKIKPCRGAHSEINAMILADAEKLKGSTLYITMEPCHSCMKALNNAGVIRIVYLHDYWRIKEGGNGKERENEAKELAGKRGIFFEKFSGDMKLVKKVFKELSLLKP